MEKPDGTIMPMRNGVRTRFIPGGEQQLVFRMIRTADNAPYWDLAPVEACVRDESREFMP